MSLKAISKYLYLTATPHRLTELVSAECVALTGSTPNTDGIAVSDTRVDVRRGAYLKSCSEVLFESTSLTELCASIRSMGLHADEFRVSVVKKPRNLKINSMTLARDVGNAIGGSANLSQPRTTFLTVVTAEKIWFGRLLSESDGVWLAHNQRPYVTSSSLPARLARVLVNLVAFPGDRLLDPCCGTGTIVMSAAHSGIHAVGYDVNPRMIGATTKNLQHFGLSADVALGDARQIDGQYDAIATDLPYGINLVRDSSQEIEILSNLRTCAPKAAFIDLRDLSETLTDLGYQIEAVLPVPKLSIVRRIFIVSVTA
ncbi:MAG: methyltransferase domain-containing protein [Candidatus Poribacteria bacterium]|nr:methyltransferase domain-containing protein [Candidatus Poribacteria bacterium]